MGRKQIKGPQGWRKYVNDAVEVATVYGKIIYLSRAKGLHRGIPQTIWKWRPLCLEVMLSSCKLERDTGLIRSGLPSYRGFQNIVLKTQFKRPHKGSKSFDTRFKSYSEDISADLAARLAYQKSKGALPNLELNHTQAVERQLQVLKDNNQPYSDHGVEALYRFSNFDPFKRSLYFGRPLDLGQFERFRRIFHTPEYAVLLCHKSHRMCSSLQVSEIKWKQRVEVCGEKPNDDGVFTFSMVQRVGGHFDGIWFCESLIAERAPEINT